MRNLKSNKGITLVALIITIIVLLILAVVAISEVNGDGIISKAKLARTNYQVAQGEENTTLAGYQETLDSINGEGNGGGSSSGTTIAKLSTITSAVSKNTVVEDEFGNKVTIPNGFKLASDSGANVTTGVVIEDANGNQFVWVPVGTIYTDAAKTEANAKKIELNRYTFDSSTGTPTAQGENVIDSYYQELATSTYGNATAKNLSGFKTSVTNNGGYYIGRYEAGTATARTDGNDFLYTAVCKYNSPIYNYVRQGEASRLAQEMYTSSDFTSDLVNSYAWDTAIVYIQTFGTGADANKYSVVNKSTSFASTGKNNDKYCNIYDMSGNVYEWTTETHTNSITPCVFRGGFYIATLALAVLAITLAVVTAVVLLTVAATLGFAHFYMCSPERLYPRSLSYE